MTDRFMNSLSSWMIGIGILGTVISRWIPDISIIFLTLSVGGLVLRWGMSMLESHTFQSVREYENAERKLLLEIKEKTERYERIPKDLLARAKFASVLARKARIAVLGKDDV